MNGIRNEELLVPPASKRWLASLARNEWLVAVVACTFVYVALLPATAAASAWFGLLMLTLGLLYIVAHFVWNGRAARMAREQGASNLEEVVKRHFIGVQFLTVWTLVGVIAIRQSVEKEGGNYGDPNLFRVHLAFVACLVLSYLFARFWFNGRSNTPKLHRWFAYPFMFFYLTTFSTGAMLILERFPVSEPEYICSGKLGGSCVVKTALPVNFKQ